MKHKIRDAMLAVLAEACEALPNANDLIGDSRTRVATATRVLFAESIAHAYRTNRTGVDPVETARTLVAREDFRDAGRQMAEALKISGGYRRDDIEIAGCKFEKGNGVRVDGEWMSYRTSYAEDRAIDSYHDTTPCASRIDDILSVYRTAFETQFPDLDSSAMRYEKNAKGESGIVLPGWNEKCQFGEHFTRTGHGAAHDPLTAVAECARRHMETSRKRCDHALRMHHEGNAMRAAIEARIAKLAPELPFKLVDLELHDRYGDITVRMVYEGTGFNFRPAPIESKMKKDIDHYVQHVLPGIVNAQRQLRARMDAGDPDNVLIEEPLARLLMDKYGDGWIGKVDEILAKRSGAGDKDEGWTARLNQGVLRGSFRLADGIEWENGALHVPNQLPDTILMQLRGRLLSQIVEHPWIQSETRITAAEAVERYRRDATGNYVTVFSHTSLKTDVPSLRIGDFRERLAKAA